MVNLLNAVVHEDKHQDVLTPCRVAQEKSTYRRMKLGNKDVSAPKLHEGKEILERNLHF